MSESRYATAREIATEVAAADRTAVDIISEHLQRIEIYNARLNCYVEVFADVALARAASIDAHIAAGEPAGPLAGVPVALKDNIATAVGKTTCGSRILESYRSPFDATVVTRLEDAGAIVIGKTNLDEFAMGSSTEHGIAGPARNPWDTDRVTGGSSGGSACAVAAGLCVVALGSDTGGSIRQPAGFCGVVGLKPTYGRISRHGLVAFGSSLDQIGPLTRSVEDAALVLQVIAGADVHDSTTADRGLPPLAESLESPPEDLTIGVPRQYRDASNHPDVARALDSTIDAFEKAGATIVEVDLPLTSHGIATYYVIAPAEASSNLARYDGVRYGRRAELGAEDSLEDLYLRSRSEGFGPEVQRRIMLGTYVLSAGHHDQYYQRALKVRRLIKEEFDRAFERCDALLGPTSPQPAFAIGEKTDPLAMYQCDVYTVNTNIAGICGISLTAGFSGDGAGRLPIGMQLQCKAFDEPNLLRIAALCERIVGRPESPPVGRMHAT